jgi:hypothetical protein
MSIELIVRPFQTTDVTPPRVVPPATATALSPIVRLVVGRTGSTRTFHSSYSNAVTYYVKKWPKETLKDSF